jgi:hypothetical protein
MDQKRMHMAVIYEPVMFHRMHQSSIRISVHAPGVAVVHHKFSHSKQLKCYIEGPKNGTILVV